MDPVVAELLRFSRETRWENVSAEAKEEIKKRIMDSLITSYAAFGSTPVKIAMNALMPVNGRDDSSVYFTGKRAEPQVAAFINGTMTRYHDYNDTYLSKEALHPSDNIPPNLALAESRGLGGKELMLSIAVSYGVIAGLADAVCIRDLGWDHVTYISISSAAGMAHLLKLDQEKFESAISLAINNNISLRQTRAGELSMWKGATAANACRNSMFATLLAEKGMTGPYQIFTGEMGFFKQVSGPFELRLDRNAVLRTMIKNFPVEYHSMSAAEVAVSLKQKIRSPIRKITIETFSVAHKIIVKDPEKLRPKTKETADHSLPYIVAYSLLYGDPNIGSYSERYLKDEKILKLIDSTKIVVNGDYDKTYPSDLPVRITVETDQGTVSSEMRYPKGHYRNPYSWEDLRNKGEKVMEKSSYSAIESKVRNLEEIGVPELMEVVRNVKAD